MVQSKYDKSLSACFSGHRIIPYFHLKRLEPQLRTAIISVYADGFRNFFCGMAMGYDLLAAETVLSLQSELPDLRLIAVIPYRGQTERWSDAMKSRHDDILRNANDTVILSEHYYQGCLLRRNDYMVVHSSRLIAWYNGNPKGGTFYTCRITEANGLTIINLYDSRN